MITREMLFGQELDARLSYRIPVLHVAKDGTQFAFCEARLGTGNDWDPMYLQMRRKKPGGEWELPVNIAYNDHGPAHNPAAFDVNGALHLLYGMDYARFYHVVSLDGGDTFSAPEDITYVFEQFRARCDWHCIAVGPGGICRLDTGRIVAPVWLGGLVDPHQHSPAQTASIYSDDDGATWHAGEIIDLFKHGPSEAQIAALPQNAPAKAIISLRNNDPIRRRMFAYSQDGAAWSEPEFARDVIEINCEGSIVRMGDKLVITGPEPLDAESGMAHRERLALRVSRDYGRSWSEPKILESGIAGYSALAETAEGSLLCLYETWEDWHMMRQVLLTLSPDELD